MKTLYLTIVFSGLMISACADPTANKPKASTTAPSTANQATTKQSSTALSETKGTAIAITPENSKIEFTGSKVTGKHDGGFKQFTGTIDMVGEKAEASTVKVDIEMNSLFTDTDGLTKHLMTADFFEVEKFPKASFVSTKIVPPAGQAGPFNVTGDFEIRGVKKSITFPATIRVLADKIMVLAEFSINRKDFGIVYAGKADDLIRDDVLIRMELNPTRTK
ncbi:MAG: YceI family protein [Pyrinomonadaceae bacterium]|nr:YceI family protein [Acidobacteriota bacterium]MBK7934887.1 YceI family protein [Acidobacteriota bacterium]MBP7377420.1 YceI family protein [Pyrinomonadaceae bacterium]